MYDAFVLDRYNIEITHKVVLLAEWKQKFLRTCFCVVFNHAMCVASPCCIIHMVVVCADRCFNFIVCRAMLPDCSVLVADVNECSREVINKNLMNDASSVLLPHCDIQDGGVPCKARSKLNMNSAKNVNCVRNQLECTGHAMFVVSPCCIIWLWCVLIDVSS